MWNLSSSVIFLFPKSLYKYKENIIYLLQTIFMDLSLEEFLGNRNQIVELTEELSERVFLKTEIDVVYSDFVNWERYGLFILNDESKKGKHKRLSYFEYVWVKVIELLASYGFKYNEIKEVKKVLFENIFGEETIKTVLENRELIQNRVEEGKIEYNPIDKSDFEQLHMSLLQFMVVQAIINKEHWTIHVDKANPSCVIPFAASIDSDMLVKNIDFDYSLFLKRSFLNISLSSIISNFLKEGELAFDQRRMNVITKEEHSILKILRNKPKSLRSIKVKYKNQIADMIEVSSLKKVELESRFMEHIKKGEYLNIEIVTDKDGIIKYENTRKIKL